MAGGVAGGVRNPHITRALVAKSLYVTLVWVAQCTSRYAQREEGLRRSEDRLREQRAALEASQARHEAKVAMIAQLEEAAEVQHTSQVT